MSKGQSNGWKEIMNFFTQSKDLKAIKEIENIIDKKLEPCPLDADIIDWKQEGCYMLNEQQQVTDLNLYDCKLTNCNFLKALPNLKQLQLSYNSISDINVLKTLPNLTCLYLSSNQISDINVLKSLPNLTRLYLRANNLSDIGVLKNLPNLTELGLSNNKISNISVLKALPNLTWLDLSYNKISEIPEWLLGLNIPIVLGFNIPDAKTIYIEGNPIKQPPFEIIKQGNKAIRAYFDQLKQGQDTIYEAKLILVGEGGSGKTSLANKIINPNWQLIPETKSESTKGIDILSYQFPYKDKTFRVNIWDFGGQQIYHQTHQFFLTKRSLYCLLTDGRKEDTDFYHWLNIVDLLSDNSPVLIIKNEKSNRSRDIPEQELKEFNNIKDTLATDLSDNRGLPEIVKALQHFITNLPHIGSPLPKTWVKVREQLEQLAKKKNCIDLKEYFEICQANGFEKAADKLQLSEYLHDLGVCLHFQNHPLLLKTLILKPTWATDAVYKVLDNETVRKRDGHFNDQDLADIWQAEEYNTMRGELLALMQKFKLCYEIPRKAQHYIAPQLLKDKAPQYEWQTGDNLLLRYKYDFMPKGILSQFIVEMHEYIANNYEWVWKSGVILEKENTQAEIIEYYGKREIHIRVHGNNKKELLTIISFKLDEINSSYERLKDKCKKLIPCNCEKCLILKEPHFFEEPVLKQFRLDGQPIQCPKSYKMVNVLELIDDIKPPSSENQESWKKQINITIAGDEVMTGENKTINVSGGTFIDGGVKVKNGDFVSGNKIVTNSQGMSKEEFLKLLQALKEDLPNSGLPAEIIEDANDSLQAVENQVSSEKPNQSTIKRKLEYVNGVLEDAGQAMETVEKGKEIFEKMIDTVKFLVSAIATASLLCKKNAVV